MRLEIKPITTKEYVLSLTEKEAYALMIVAKRRSMIIPDSVNPEIENNIQSVLKDIERLIQNSYLHHELTNTPHIKGRMEPL